MSVLLKDLPKEDLPRERLISNGVSNLSNEELIAILLRTGTKNSSAKNLADNVISYSKGIKNLKNITIQELTKIKGMGIAKSTNLIAALELGKRVYMENRINDKEQIRCAIEAYGYFGSLIEDEEQENFLVIYLDNQRQYITHKILFKGTINESLVHPREVFKNALTLGSSRIIIMHNHPSGVLKPSNCDIELTKRIIDAGNIIGVKLDDHIIVGRGEYYSFHEDDKIEYL